MSKDIEDSSSSEEFILRELQQDDNVNISLGADYVDLKTFFRKRAKEYHNKNVAKTFVLASSKTNKIGGYVSLVCSQVSLVETGRPDDVNNYPYNDFPATKIARLAVDQKYRSNGLGKELINWSIAISRNKVMPFIGCRFLVVDSKPCAIGFYESNGFTLLNTVDNKKNDHPLLYIDLYKLKNPF